MRGTPLNYFVFPYAEAGGKPHGDLKRTVQYTPN
jgi:hypothetical protein